MRVDRSLAAAVAAGVCGVASIALIVAVARSFRHAIADISNSEMRVTIVDASGAVVYDTDAAVGNLAFGSRFIHLAKHHLRLEATRAAFDCRLPAYSIKEAFIEQRTLHRTGYTFAALLITYVRIPSVKGTNILRGTLHLVGVEYNIGSRLAAKRTFIGIKYNAVMTATSKEPVGNLLQLC